MMRCGPASVEAVKSGQVGYTYDTPFVFSEVNADVCHFKEDPSSSWGFTRLKMNQYHVGRKIVTKRVGLDDDIGDADVWDVTYFYKNPEGSREERMAVFNAVKGVDKAQKMYNFPTVAQQDVGFDLVEIDSKNFGQEFSIVVNIENRSAKERNIDAILTASSVFYTGATVHRLKRAHGQFKIQPHGKETLRLRVSPVDYADKLVDHSLIKIHAIASVLETRQTWSEEDDFPLLKPHMNVEIRGERRVGQGCTATFSFTNTIGRELTHCKLSIEGPGLQWPKVIKCRDISPGEVYSYTESFHPRRPGETKIVATFTSKQLVDVIGSATVMQKSTIALELLEALKSRILLRRTELSQILQYLQKGSQDVVEVFKRISKFTIIKKIVSLTKRLTHENLEDTEDMEVVQETSLPISFQISNETILESDKVNVNALKRKLQAAIDETLNTSPVPAFKKIPSGTKKMKLLFLKKQEPKERIYKMCMIS
uniref:Transglutaminase C-terminal domain-containing protein n=1 Tax=Rhodnius prolixus TaxID=13249 RepID=T1I8S6_RHOPR